jgi:hypothetical protein
MNQKKIKDSVQEVQKRCLETKTRIEEMKKWVINTMPGTLRIHDASMKWKHQSKFYEVDRSKYQILITECAKMRTTINEIHKKHVRQAKAKDKLKEVLDTHLTVSFPSHTIHTLVIMCLHTYAGIHTLVTCNV